MTDLIILLVVAALLIGAVGYIIREKRAGSACIGCPHGRSCPSGKHGHCSCHK